MEKRSKFSFQWLQVGVALTLFSVNHAFASQTSQTYEDFNKEYAAGITRVIPTFKELAEKARRGSASDLAAIEKQIEVLGDEFTKDENLLQLRKEKRSRSKENDGLDLLTKLLGLQEQKDVKALNDKNQKAQSESEKVSSRLKQGTSANVNWKKHEKSCTDNGVKAEIQAAESTLPYFSKIINAVKHNASLLLGKEGKQSEELLAKKNLEAFAILEDMIKNDNPDARVPKPKAVTGSRDDSYPAQIAELQASIEKEKQRYPKVKLAFFNRAANILKQGSTFNGLKQLVKQMASESQGDLEDAVLDTFKKAKAGAEASVDACEDQRQKFAQDIQRANEAMKASTTHNLKANENFTRYKTLYSQLTCDDSSIAAIKTLEDQSLAELDKTSSNVDKGLRPEMVLDGVAKSVQNIVKKFGEVGSKLDPTLNSCTRVAKFKKLHRDYVAQELGSWVWSGGSPSDSDQGDSVPAPSKKSTSSFANRSSGSRSFGSSSGSHF